MQRIGVHSQATAGGRVQRGARGGGAGLAGRGAPGAARASGPRRHVHEAAHLDAHALLEGRLPRRRHARAPSCSPSLAPSHACSPRLLPITSPSPSEYSPPPHFAFLHRDC